MLYTSLRSSIESTSHPCTFNPSNLKDFIYYDASLAIIAVGKTPTRFFEPIRSEQRFDFSKSPIKRAQGAETSAADIIVTQRRMKVLGAGRRD